MVLGQHHLRHLSNSGPSINVQLCIVGAHSNLSHQSSAHIASRSLADSTVYITKLLQYSGLEATVDKLWTTDSEVSSGVIGPETRAVFRSRSALYHIVVQVSAEMWQVGGFLYICFPGQRASFFSSESIL